MATRMGPTLTRLFWLCAGIAIIVFCLIGNDFAGHPLPVWRRAVGFGGGFFFVYCGLAFYLPGSRKRREARDKARNG